jgi:FdhD protein
VDERVVTLMLNGSRTHQWRCTPDDIEALVVGRLYLDGLIARADDVNLIVEDRADGSTEVQARSSATSIRAVVERACAIPETNKFVELFRELFTAVDARHEHGGMHAAAATDGQRIIKQLEDVGRHNTIDKIVGALLLDRIAPSQLGLLISSRVSGEIADKAARAGFCWLASRSIPTTLAVTFGSAAGMPIIGRAASRDSFVYQ